MLGFAGSVHCVLMCGPLAMVLPGGNARWPNLLLGRLLYNAGRILTYGALGAAAGTLGQLLRLGGLQQGLSIALGVVVLLGLFGYLRLKRAPILQRFVRGLRTPIARLMKRQDSAVLLGIGLLNGLLPCGLVYAALALAATGGTAAGGAVFMLTFGLGTLPVMFAVSIAGSKLRLPRLRHAGKWLPAMIAVVGLLLVVRGLGLGVPYLSPQPGQPGSCCDVPAVE